ncbi:hypothetical protein CLOP_g9651 [Closterium sp. NIES-67]|nr:hypothetical protein CLOP_g9651 [Closterium sp. NIES-67]
MEDVGKQAWAKRVVEGANEVINYVRNHHWTRNFLREPGELRGKVLQLLKPAGTRFGTQYIAVSRLVDLHGKLTVLVAGETWKAWAVGKQKAAADSIQSIVLNQAWWAAAEFFVKLLKLPYLVMRSTDSSAKGMMGQIYELMLKLTVDVTDLLKKEDLQLTPEDKEGIGEIIQHRWDRGD